MHFLNLSLFVILITVKEDSGRGVIIRQFNNIEHNEISDKSYRGNVLVDETQQKSAGTSHVAAIILLFFKNYISENLQIFPEERRGDQ